MRPLSLIGKRFKRLFSKESVPVFPALSASFFAGCLPIERSSKEREREAQEGLRGGRFYRRGVLLLGASKTSREEVENNNRKNGGKLTHPFPRDYHCHQRRILVIFSLKRSTEAASHSRKLERAQSKGKITERRATSSSSFFSGGRKKWTKGKKNSTLASHFFSFFLLTNTIVPKTRREKDKFFYAAPCPSALPSCLAPEGRAHRETRADPAREAVPALRCGPSSRRASRR